jgi:hypothetical protein
LATNKRKAKDKIAHKTIQKIRAKEGRFLKKLTSEEARPLGVKGEIYAIVDDTIVLEKTKQALRFVGRRKAGDSTGDESKEQPSEGINSPAATERLPGVSSAVAAFNAPKPVASSTMPGRNAVAGREGPMSLRAQSGMMDSMAAFQLQPTSQLPTLPPSMANAHNSFQQSLLLEAHYRQQALAQQSHPFASLAAQPHLSHSLQRSSSQLDRISLAFQAELANLSNMRSSLSGFANPLPIAQDPFAPLRHLGPGRPMATQHPHQHQSMAAAVQLQAALGRTPTGLSHTLMGNRASGMDPTSPMIEAILQSHRLQELEHLAFSSQASDRGAVDSAITALLRRGYASGATTHPEDSRSADPSVTSNRNPNGS